MLNNVGNNSASPSLQCSEPGDERCARSVAASCVDQRCVVSLLLVASPLTGLEERGLGTVGRSRTTVCTMPQPSARSRPTWPKREGETGPIACRPVPFLGQECMHVGDQPGNVGLLGERFALFLWPRECPIWQKPSPHILDSTISRSVNRLITCRRCGIELQPRRSKFLFLSGTNRSSRSGLKPTVPIRPPGDPGQKFVRTSRKHFEIADSLHGTTLRRPTSVRTRHSSGCCLILSTHKNHPPHDSGVHVSGVPFGRIDGVLCGQRIADLALRPIRLIISARDK